MDVYLLLCSEREKRNVEVVAAVKEKVRLQTGNAGPFYVHTFTLSGNRMN